MQTFLPKRLTEHLLLMHLGVESVFSPWMQKGLSGAPPRSETEFVLLLCAFAIL